MDSSSCAHPATRPGHHLKRVKLLTVPGRPGASSPAAQRAAAEQAGAADPPTGSPETSRTDTGCWGSRSTRTRLETHLCLFFFPLFFKFKIPFANTQPNRQGSRPHAPSSGPGAQSPVLPPASPCHRRPPSRGISQARKEGKKWRDGSRGAGGEPSRET